MKFPSTESSKAYLATNKLYAYLKTDKFYSLLSSAAWIVGVFNSLWFFIRYNGKCEYLETFEFCAKWILCLSAPKFIYYFFIFIHRIYKRCSKFLMG